MTVGVATSLSVISEGIWTRVNLKHLISPACITSIKEVLLSPQHIFITFRWDQIHWGLNEYQFLVPTMKLTLLSQANIMHEVGLVVGFLDSNEPKLDFVTCKISLNLFLSFFFSSFTHFAPKPLWPELITNPCCAAEHCSKVSGNVNYVFNMRPEWKRWTLENIRFHSG